MPSASKWQEPNNPAANKKWRREMIAQQTGKCGICPPHAGENRNKGRRSKPDKHKNIDRKSIRHTQAAA